uniref:AraC family transcriptional regulator n=1 Tax=Heterorhabditis bacteriophora TaxID=37862 RepID=A0A1I7XC83_HETBA
MTTGEWRSVGRQKDLNIVSKQYRNIISDMGFTDKRLAIGYEHSISIDQ